MKQTRTKKEQDHERREQEIVDYLQKEPAFFERHPEVLVQLGGEQTQGGGVISLAERRMDVLREKNKALEQKMQNLVDAARQYENLGKRLHGTSVKIARLSSTAETGDIPAIIEGEFNLDHVVLRLGVEQSVANTGSAETQTGDASYRSVLERVSQGRSICDDRLPKSVLTLLFGEHAESIRSCALIPVVAGGDGVCGVLALGALEAERFRPNMGTVYLDRLGELVGTTVERLRGAGG